MTVLCTSPHTSARISDTDITCRTQEWSNLEAFPSESLGAAGMVHDCCHSLQRDSQSIPKKSFPLDKYRSWIECLGKWCITSSALKSFLAWWKGKQGGNTCRELQSSNNNFPLPNLLLLHKVILNFYFGWIWGVLILFCFFADMLISIIVNTIVLAPLSCCRTMV